MRTNRLVWPARPSHGWLVGIVLAALLAASPQAHSSVDPPAEALGGTRVRPGVLVFRLQPALKSRASLHQIEFPALQEALQVVGAANLTQKFPRAVPAPPEKAAEGVDLQLVYQISFDAAQPFNKVRARLLASGALTYIEPLYERNVLFQPNDPLADSVGGFQYHLKNIRAYRGWDFEQGDSSVVVGITDTGTRFQHQDLASQEARNYADPINGLDDDGDGYVDNFRGWDIADDDNDPSCDANAGGGQPYHGVLVTGAVAAHTNNGKGVAGIGFKCRYLPIKIYPGTSGGGFAGFEGIVYAADHGCKVINCSWGGPSAPSRFEQDVITYATVNRDAVVVAAAGNTAANLDFYPAAYKGVLAVVVVDRNDIKGASNTWSYFASLAAPGKQIGTTYIQTDSAYVPVSGSSFASPLVAGTVALVRHHFPALSATQAAERVRMTADTSIYALSGNAAYRDQLGHGRLNLLRAVTDTAVRSVRATASTFNREKPYYAGDTLLLTAQLRNYLAPMRHLIVTLSSPSPYVQVIAGSFDAGAMPTLGTTTNAGLPFQLVLLPNTPLNTVVPLRYGFRDSSGYTDYQYIKIEVNPDYVTLDANRLAATITSRGNIGFDNGNQKRGDGVTFEGGDLLLAEGGLLVGRDTTRVSDMIRGALGSQPDHDFVAVNPIHFRHPVTEPNAEQQAEGIFQDTARATRANVRVMQRAWSGNAGGIANTVFLGYDVINQDTAALTTGYVGLYADWDIYQYSHNRAQWDTARRLAYTSTVVQDSVYAGVQLLSAQVAGTYAFDNFNASATPVNSSNGLTNAEKYRALQAGPGAPTSAANNSVGSDVAQLVSARLPLLAVGDTARVAFAMLVAHSLIELQAAADSAQAAYNFSIAPTPAAPVALSGARCGAGAVTLSATGAPTPGGSYRWYAQATGGTAISGQTGATFTTPNLGATTVYYVAVRSAAGRESARVAITATINPVPVATVAVSGATTFCAGDSVRLLGPADPSLTISFLLNGQPTSVGVAAAVLTARQSGVYAVVVRNAAGCADTSAVVMVTVNPAPVAQIQAGSPTTFCAGSVVSLNATPAPQPGESYLWSNGDTTRSTTVNLSDTLTVTITNASGCAATSAPQIVTAEPLPAAPTLTQTPQSGGVLLMVSGGAPGVTYQFYLNGVALPVAGTTSYLVTTPGSTGPYTATAISALGCASLPSAGLTVTVVTGLAPAAASLALDLYPNPASVSESATLVLRGATGATATVTVLDQLGRCVLTHPLPADGAPTALPALPAGVYAVRVRTVEGMLLMRRLAVE